MIVAIENFCLQSITYFIDLFGTFELAIIFCTLIIRLLILPFKIPIDFNYLKKASSKVYFDIYLNFTKEIQDPELLKHIKKEKKQLQNQISFLSFFKICILLFLQITAIIIFVGAIGQIDSQSPIANSQKFTTADILLIVILLNLVMIDYYLRQYIAYPESIGYMFPYLLCLLMISISYTFTPLFLYYLITTYIFNIISFYLTWLFSFKKLKTLVYTEFSLYYMKPRVENLKNTY